MCQLESVKQQSVIDLIQRCRLRGQILFLQLPSRGQNHFLSSLLQHLLSGLLAAGPARRRIILLSLLALGIDLGL